MKLTGKILAAVLAAASVSMTLAGCSNGDGTGSSGTGTESSAAASTEESASSGETVNISWIQAGTQPNDLEMVSDAMNEYSKEKINVTCDYTYLDWGVYGDRMKAMIQAGDQFDIMYINGSPYYTSPIEMGSLAALDDYLDKVPELKSFIPETLWDGVRYKGKIYSVPTYKDSSSTLYWSWPKDVVETCGIPVEDIVTPQDLDPWLYKVQEAIDAGKINSSYALYLQNGGLPPLLKPEKYDLNNNDIFLGADMEDSTGKVVRILEQPDVMENLKLLHKWYQDGLINPDAPTATSSPTTLSFAYHQAFPGAETSLMSIYGDREIVMNVQSGPLYTTASVQGSMNAISASSSHIVEALKYLELVNLDPKMRNMLGYGIEGTHWTDNGDGTVTRDKVKTSDYNPPLFTQATFFTMAPVAPNQADQWTKVKDWVENSESSPYLGFIFDTAPVETELAACVALRAQYAPNILTGAVDPETAVPEYYAAMDAAGLQKVQDEMQKQLDEFLAQK